MKSRWLLGGALVIILALSWVGVTHAAAVKSGPTVTVTKDQVVDHTLYTAGRTIDIQGTVNGDVVCVGNDVTIEGTVDGDILCAAQNLQISGLVTGDVRAVGQSVTVSGTIQHNLSVAANNLHVDGNATVTRDLAAAASTATIDGKIGRDANLTSSTITFSNSVGRDVAVNANTVQLEDGTMIGGDFHYRSANAALVASGAQVAGQTTRSVVASQPRSNFVRAGLIGSFVYWLLAFLFACLLLALAAPRLLLVGGEVAHRRLGRTIVVGLLSLLVLPAVIGVSFISVIGIPVAIFLGLSLMAGLLLSGPLFAFYLGSQIWPRKSVVISVLIGGVVLIILNALPIIGILSALASTIVGFGIVMTLVLQRLHAGQWLASAPVTTNKQPKQPKP